MDLIDTERRQRAEAKLGSWLCGKWRLDQIVGAGGMATVFLATHRNGRRVAVKLLHPEVAMMTEARRRFVNEGYAANRIDHPGVVAVLDDDRDEDGAPFLVMEMLEGESLEHRREARGGALPPLEVLGFADQVLDVLASAHDKGVIHRDIKPENLFVTREGQVKVLDFGLARLQELHGDARLTASNGGIMGTPAYLPPEQARGRWDDIDARTDLWALGATMFTLASGRIVHDAGTLNEMLVAAITRPAPPLASVLPGAPAAFAAVVDRALATAPAERYQSARAMQEAVRRALGAAPEPARDSAGAAGLAFMSTLAAARSAPGQRASGAGASRRRAPLVVGALASLAAGAVVTVLLLRSRPPETAALPAPPPVTASLAGALGPASPSITLTAPSVTPSAATVAPSASAPSPAPPPVRSVRPAGRRPIEKPAPAVANDDPMDRRH